MGVTSKTTCKIDGCTTAARCREMCDTHYRRVVRYGSPEPRRVAAPETCSIEGCDRPHQARGYCMNHYKRALREEWGLRPKAPSTRQIRPIGVDLSAEPLVRHVEARGGLAAVTSWMGTIKSVGVERWKRNYERAKDRGYLDLAVADEFCCKVLRIHPYFVWGEIWWEHEEIEQAAA